MRPVEEILRTMPRNWDEVIQRVADELIELGYTERTFWDEFMAGGQIVGANPRPLWAIKLHLPDYIWTGIYNSLRDSERGVRRIPKRR